MANSPTIDSPARNLTTMTRVQYANWLKTTQFRNGCVPTYRLTPTSSPAPAWSKMDVDERAVAKVLQNL